MYGVVIWSSVKEKKAVFWCEDHGDLVFFHNQEAVDENAEPMFGAGDLVQFDVYLDAKVRKARNPKLIREKANLELTEKLRHHGSLSRAAERRGQVLHFSAQPPVPTLSAQIKPA